MSLSNAMNELCAQQPDSRVLEFTLHLLCGLGETRCDLML